MILDRKTRGADIIIIIHLTTQGQCSDHYTDTKETHSDNIDTHLTRHSQARIHNRKDNLFDMFYIIIKQYKCHFCCIILAV